jgi:hypothetical protein
VVKLLLADWFARFKFVIRYVDAESPFAFPATKGALEDGVG